MRESIDVEWLTEIAMFKNNIRLVAGRGGLHRKVTYVTVQEAPDFYRQIEGGGLYSPHGTPSRTMSTPGLPLYAIFATSPPESA